MKVLSYVFAAMLVVVALLSMTEARTCKCTGCGWHMNVSERACREGSGLGWRWDDGKKHCWDITVAETTRYIKHCSNKGCDSAQCK